MRPLDDAARRRLLMWSSALCAFSVGLAPLAGRSSLEVARERTIFAARFAVPVLDNDSKMPALRVIRDPFVPESAAPIDAHSDGGAPGTRVTRGTPTGYIVPGAAPLVTAIVTGASPLALVDDGTRVRVVRRGDALAGSTVTAIDERGVRLKSGTRLPLSQDVP